MLPNSNCSFKFVHFHARRIIGYISEVISANIKNLLDASCRERCLLPKKQGGDRKENSFSTQKGSGGHRLDLYNIEESISASGLIGEV